MSVKVLSHQQMSGTVTLTEVLILSIIIMMRKRIRSVQTSDDSAYPNRIAAKC